MKHLAPVLLGFLAAAPASAQVVPIPRSDFEEAAAQYRSYALAEFNAVVAQWVGAINAGSPDRAARLYTGDAYLDLGQPARGREAVEHLLESWGGDIRHIEVGLSDFDASGNMSYGTLHIRVSPLDGRPRSGVLLLVMRKEGRTWRIRAQTLTLD
ncbi:MAG TPA: hypothetical protein VMM12_08330 [Longimicrobiales bacterium]|nr:hypothetical protein [Longimicrobiales bacterium]